MQKIVTSAELEEKAEILEIGKIIGTNNCEFMCQLLEQAFNA